MQREIAEIIWRLDLVIAAVDVEQPTERANRKCREAHCHCPEPKATVAHECRPSARVFCAFRFRIVPGLPWRFRAIRSLFAYGLVRSSKVSGNRKCGAAHQCDSRTQRV